MANQIHSTAVVSPAARLGDDNSIGPFVFVEDDVVLGSGNVVGAHSVIKSGTRLGSRNQIHEHAVIGGTPQDFKFTGVRSFAEIGDENILREGVTVHRGSRSEGRTLIGSRNFLMAYAHVAHDCVLEDGIVMANSVAVAGEVHIESDVVLGGGAMVHQFARLGRLSMIGGRSKITRDALPFSITDGMRARHRGLNLVGLKRAGFSTSELQLLKKAMRILLRSHLPLQKALEELGGLKSRHLDHLVEFIRASTRGFHR